MNRILVFDKGHIIEDGNGLYKTLWDAQVGGFLAHELEDCRICSKSFT